MKLTRLLLRQSIQIMPLLVLIVIFARPSVAQQMTDFGFTRTYDTPLVLKNNILLHNPWAGGMNSCQFSTIDLDQDGIMDLFVFDRIGNRILTFINQGTPQMVDYQYAPQYAAAFPAVSNWVALRDYNCDGKEDIFTYGGGGIKIYKNTSNAVSGLSFSLETMQLLSLMYGNYVNVFLTEVDYPVLDDLDGDKDLDILTFWIIGTYIHYHRNMSMEKYGTCDSLDFRLEEHCWGYIREGDTSNFVTLHAACPFKEISPDPGSGQLNPDDIEHIGSTLLTLDLNGNQVKDLLLGDVDYPEIIALVNGGTADSAHIISQDNHFPVNDTPIDLCSFPVCTSVDVNNDGKKDLLVSPFDPSTIITESDHSIWLYQDTGTPVLPAFHLTTKEFLQGEMVDVGTTSIPVVCDVDQDGLMDIVVGNYGFHDSSYYVSGFLHSVFRSRLVVLHNSGTAFQPEFVMADTNFAGIATLNLTNACPTFGDLDGDGDLDMMLGNSAGNLYYFENIAGSGSPLAFSTPVPDYQAIDVGVASTPQLWDLDKDGLLDLIIGNNKGTLYYYHNTGTTQTPVFQYITDSLGKVDVRDAYMSWEGYSVPCLFKTADDTTRLFVGSLNGGLAYYKGVDGNLTGVFTQVSLNYLFMKDGNNSSFGIYNFDSDAYPDLVMGSTNGGLAYFKGSVPVPEGIPEAGPDRWFSCSIYPNPAVASCMIELQQVGQLKEMTCTVYGIDGVRVARERLTSNPARMALPFAPGVYLLQVSALENSGKWILSHPTRLILLK